MDQYLPLIKGKRVGMVVNHTSIVGTEPIHLLDTLLKQKIDIVKVLHRNTVSAATRMPVKQ